MTKWRSSTAKGEVSSDDVADHRRRGAASDRDSELVAGRSTWCPPAAMQLYTCQSAGRIE